MKKKLKDVALRMKDRDVDAEIHRRIFGKKAIWVDSESKGGWAYFTRDREWVDQDYVDPDERMPVPYYTLSECAAFDAVREFLKKAKWQVDISMLPSGSAFIRFESLRAKRAMTHHCELHRIPDVLSRFLLAAALFEAGELEL